MIHWPLLALATCSSRTIVGRAGSIASTASACVDISAAAIATNSPVARGTTGAGPAAGIPFVDHDLTALDSSGHGERTGARGGRAARARGARGPAPGHAGFGNAGSPARQEAVAEALLPATELRDTARRVRRRDHAERPL